MDQGRRTEEDRPRQTNRGRQTQTHRRSLDHHRLGILLMAYWLRHISYATASDECWIVHLLPCADVVYTANSCALPTSTAWCSPCNPNGGCGSARDCTVFDPNLDYNCCADGAADCNEVLVTGLVTAGHGLNGTPQRQSS